jgi:hypothetical protein
VRETALLVHAYIVWKDADDVLQIVTIPEKKTHVMDHSNASQRKTNRNAAST